MSGTPGRNVFEHSLSGKLWDGLKKKKTRVCVEKEVYWFGEEVCTLVGNSLAVHLEVWVFTSVQHIVSLNRD